MVGTRGMPIDGDPEADRLSVRSWSKNQVKVACMKAKRNTSIGRKRSGDLVLVLPLAVERPLVQVQSAGVLYS